jgi:hypothetical protein
MMTTSPSIDCLPITITVLGQQVCGQLRKNGRHSLDYDSHVLPEWLLELEGGMAGTGAPPAELFTLSQSAAESLAAAGFDAGGWSGYGAQVLRISRLTSLNP